MTSFRYLVYLSVAVAVAGVLAYGSSMNRGCGGPLPGLGHAVMTALIVAIAAALCGAGAVTLLLPRRRAVATVLLAVGAGIFAGWWIGSLLGTANHPCPGEPAPTSRVAAATLVVKLAPPYDLVLSGTGDCYLSLTDGRAVDYIDGSANSDDGWEIQLFGLPVEDPAGRPYDSFDVDLFDGERGWSYRPTSWVQVEVERVGDPAGTTRLAGLALLSEPDGSAPADAIEGRIDWQCDRPAASGPLDAAT